MEEILLKIIQNKVSALWNFWRERDRRRRRFTFREIELKFGALKFRNAKAAAAADALLTLFLSSFHHGIVNPKCVGVM